MEPFIECTKGTKKRQQQATHASQGRLAMRVVDHLAFPDRLRLVTVEERKVIEAVAAKLRKAANGRDEPQTVEERKPPR